MQPGVLSYASMPPAENLSSVGIHSAWYKINSHPNAQIFRHIPQRWTWMIQSHWYDDQKSKLKNGIRATQHQSCKLYDWWNCLHPENSLHGSIKLRSNVEYCTPVLDHHTKKEVQKINEIQRSAVRCVSNDCHQTSSVTSMISSLHWINDGCQLD